MDNLEAIKIGAIIAAVAALIYLVKKKGSAGIQEKDGQKSTVRMNVGRPHLPDDAHTPY